MMTMVLLDEYLAVKAYGYRMSILRPGLVWMVMGAR